MTRGARPVGPWGGGFFRCWTEALWDPNCLFTRGIGVRLGGQIDPGFPAVLSKRVPFPQSASYFLFSERARNAIMFLFRREDPAPSEWQRPFLTHVVVVDLYLGCLAPPSDCRSFFEQRLFPMIAFYFHNALIPWRRGLLSALE